MRILIINYEFPPLGGGGGVFCRDLAIELAKEHEVDVLTTRFPGLGKEEKADGINIYRVPVPGRTSLHYATLLSLLSFPPCALIRGFGLFHDKKYDIINTHFAVPSGPAGLILSRVFKTPNVLSIHGGDIYNPLKKTSPHRQAPFRWAVRTVLKEASIVIAQSEDIKRFAEELYLPEREINVIPLGLANTGFAPLDRKTLSMEDDKFYVISIGRMAKIKGYDFLIKAIGLLKSKGENISLILIGDGPERASLERLSADLGLTDRVKFTGWISGERKFQYLSACDIYVMSSIHEGFGMVLLEAMSCALPIIATNKGGQTRIIEDGKSGILIPPADIEQLAAAIVALKQNAGQRKAISLYNKEHVKQYGIASAKEKYLELFNKSLTAD